MALPLLKQQFYHINTVNNNWLHVNHCVLKNQTRNFFLYLNFFCCAHNIFFNFKLSLIVFLFNWKLQNCTKINNKKKSKF